MIHPAPVPANAVHQRTVLPESGRAATIFCELGFAAREHEHAAAQVSILLKGEQAKFVSHDSNGKTTRTTITPQSFVYIAPDQPHRTHWMGYGELLNLYFPEDWLRELGEQIGCSLPSVQSSYIPDSSIHEIGRLLIEEFTWASKLLPSTVDHATVLVAHRLFRVAGRLSTGRSVGLLSQTRLQPAIELINAHPERHFLLAELARTCNSSVFHFARSFSARFGCAPFAYQRKVRLQKARDLLLGTELPVQVVGYEVGLENPTHFSRLFRRESGFSPSELRRLHRQQKS
jgi:AraC family transcriptional regulator